MPRIPALLSLVLLAAGCGDRGPFSASEAWQLVPPEYDEVELGVVGAGDRILIATLNPGDEAAELSLSADGLRTETEAGPITAGLSTQLPGAPHPPLLLLGSPKSLGTSGPSFCVRDLETRQAHRREAVLVHQSANADWYVDATDRPFFEEVDVRIWIRLAARFEGGAWPALTAVLGAPEAGGKLRILFTRAMGRTFGGYFDPKDLTREPDGTPDCAESGSNGGNVLYQNALNAAGTPDEMIEGYYPSSLAHELTHLLHFHRRCAVARCERNEETWLSEGLAKVGEDLAGGGWHLPAWRRVGAQLADGGFAGKSLTDWEAETVGHYEQAHALLRFWTDQAGPAALAAAAEGEGREALLQTLGVDFANLLAGYATALSGASPTHAYANEAWAPFTEKIGRFNPAQLPAGPIALPPAAWRAYRLTGTGDRASIRITSSRGGKPHLLLIRER